MTTPAHHPQHACIICHAPTQYYFSKTYDAKYIPNRAPLTVDYEKCSHCGFVLSTTHQAMDEEFWVQLNHEWHTVWDSWDLDLDANLTNRPPFTEQAIALSILGKNGLLNLDSCVDYAAGYGFLSRISKKYFAQKINIYDKYVHTHDAGVDYLSTEQLGKYDLVLNSAMFEHVISRASLDEVHALTSERGVLAIHSVICENIPQNPDWFYLSPPVHTAFHTNKSMEQLMQQWGYVESIYCPQAKTWYLFKEAAVAGRDLAQLVHQINQELQTKWFYHKKGFVDYWKGF